MRSGSCCTDIIFRKKEKLMRKHHRKELQMSYELLVLDIDGTLTNSEKKVTERTLQAIRQIQQKGKKIAIASGRPTAGVTGIAKTIGLDQTGGYILSYNGGRIADFKTGEVIYSKTIPMELIPEIYKSAIEYDTKIITYEGDQAISGNGVDKYIELETRINGIGIKETDKFVEYVTFPVNKCLMTGEPSHMEVVERNLANRFEAELNIFRSEPFFVEIMPKNIDKAYSLGKLLDYLHLTKEQMICCGDGFNDLSMIKYAGLGVAMANAQPVVKEAADFITASNDEDGVADVIEKFML